jgi:hypothetical protein
MERFFIEQIYYFLLSLSRSLSLSPSRVSGDIKSQVTKLKHKGMCRKKKQLRRNSVLQPATIAYSCVGSGLDGSFGDQCCLRVFFFEPIAALIDQKPKPRAQSYSAQKFAKNGEIR